MNTSPRMRRLSIVAIIVVVAYVLSAAPQAATAQDGAEAPSEAPAVYLDDLNYGSFVLPKDGPKTMDFPICNHGGDTLRFVKPGDSDPMHLFEWARDMGFTVESAEIAGLKDAALRSGECYTIHVTFTPTKSGFFRVTGRIWATTRTMRDTTVWTATVTRPIGMMTSYDWDRQWVVDGPCSKNSRREYEAIVDISNVGTSPLRVRSLVMVGPDSLVGRFRFDTSQRATTVKPGDQCNPGSTLRQKVLFIPTEERVYSVQLRLATEAGDTITSTLSGIGIESHGAITGITFDTVGVIDGSSQRKSVTINALPTRPLTISGFTILGPDAGSFAIDSIITPLTLLPGASALLPVRFTPARAGAHSAEIAFIGDHSLCDDSSATLEGFVKGSSGVGRRVDARGIEVEAVSGGEGEIALRYSLATSANLSIEIYDAAGEKVATLLDGKADGGAHTITWNTAAIPSGIYYCHIVSGTWQETLPIIVRH